MTHKTFIQALAKRLNMDDEKVATLTEQYVETFVKEVQTNGVVSVQGFGNFVLKEKAERKMYNPSTKTYKVIPSKTVLGFKMGAKLKNLINNV